MTRTGWAMTVLGAALLLGACVEDRGRPPVARLQVEPRWVPVGVESVIQLDGRKSCDEIDFPETCDKTTDGSGPPLTCPGGLSFRWTLDQPYTAVGGEGAMREPVVEVRVTPDRPLTVTLEVTDCDSNAVTTRTQVGIILDYPTTDGTP